MFVVVNLVVIMFVWFVYDDLVVVFEVWYGIKKWCIVGVIECVWF